jgi:HD-like signal output (HDOD) protein/GGDEF domain-containing protein
MRNDIIERILSCEQLPTLPAVGARVLELSNDPNVGMSDLARAIEHDQGLAAKVLRTANSSYVGLRCKCNTLDQALVMLGLSTVKNLVLGFTLVDTVAAREIDGFDYIAFWRRAIYAAIGARGVARTLGASWGDEAFLCGLLQDMGVIAMFQALGREYADVVASAAGEHRLLVERELAALDVQHPQVGAMLAERWNLSDDLVLSIRYHERPTAAPEAVADKVKAVALGNQAHDVLTDGEPAAALKEFERNAKAWCGIGKSAATSLLREISEAVDEVAHLFQVETGSNRDVDDVLTQAGPGACRAGVRRETIEGLIRSIDGEDPLTGLLTREAFDRRLESMLEDVCRRRRQLTLMLIGLDATSAKASSTLDRVFDSVEQAAGTGRAICAKYTNDSLGVILPGYDQLEAERLAGSIRALLEGGSTPCGDAAWQISVGIVAVPPDAQAPLDRAESVTCAAAGALESARGAGGCCNRTFVGRLAA